MAKSITLATIFYCVNDEFLVSKHIDVNEKYILYSLGGLRPSKMVPGALRPDLAIVS